MKHVLTASVFCLCFLVGCADQPGDNSAYQVASENCSSQFISDHNGIASDFRMLQYKSTVGDLRSELTKLRSKIQSFQTKYASVNCKAAKDNDYSINPDETWINADSKSRQWLQAIDDMESKLNAL